MKRKLLFTGVITLVVIFTGLAIYGAIHNTQVIHSKNIEIESKTFKLQKLETEFKKLNADYQKEQDNNTLDATKEKEYLERIQKMEADYKALELSKANEKAEKDRIAQAQSRLAQTVVPKASASTGGHCVDIQNKLAALGVPADQLAAAGRLAMRESSCNEYVVNSIGACGAFQSLPCGKWGSPGTDEYYRGAINYANSRYGGYNQALAFSLANNWY